MFPSCRFWAPFLLYICIVLFQYVRFFFNLIVFYFIISPSKPVYFPMRDRKGMDADGRGGGEELGRVEGGETIKNIYYMRKESIFNKGEEIWF